MFAHGYCAVCIGNVYCCVCMNVLLELMYVSALQQIYLRICASVHISDIYNQLRIL